MHLQKQMFCWCISEGIAGIKVVSQSLRLSMQKSDKVFFIDRDNVWVQVSLLMIGINVDTLSGFYK